MRVFKSLVIWSFGAMLLAPFVSPRAARPEPVPSDTAARLEPRSVTSGLFLAAVFPGPFIHGAGNYYAGAPAAGAVMTVAEIVGAGAIIAGFASGGLDLFDNEEDDETGEALMAGGLVLFWGSWLADIATTPFQVHRYNRRLAQRGMVFGVYAAPPAQGRPPAFGVTIRF
ncbi:MAG TPA: hypothetical protein PLR32_03185 [candidate division Zixibacteria bacterium]|nr:hypothetical protein [candidate division Zixibacteria bacterium]